MGRVQPAKRAPVDADDEDVPTRRERDLRTVVADRESLDRGTRLIVQAHDQALVRFESAGAVVQVPADPVAIGIVRRIVDAGVTEIAETVGVGVGLIGIVHAWAVVLLADQAVEVGVRIVSGTAPGRRIRRCGRVVTNVADPVTVEVRLIGVRVILAVVAEVADAVAVEVRLIRVGQARCGDTYVVHRKSVPAGRDADPCLAEGEAAVVDEDDLHGLPGPGTDVELVIDEAPGVVERRQPGAVVQRDPGRTTVCGDPDLLAVPGAERIGETGAGGVQAQSVEREDQSRRVDGKVDRRTQQTAVLFRRLIDTSGPRPAVRDPHRARQIDAAERADPTGRVTAVPRVALAAERLVGPAQVRELELEHDERGRAIVANVAHTVGVGIALTSILFGRTVVANVPPHGRRPRPDRRGRCRKRRPPCRRLRHSGSGSGPPGSCRTHRRSRHRPDRTDPGPGRPGNHRRRRPHRHRRRHSGRGSSSNCSCRKNPQ